MEKIVTCSFQKVEFFSDQFEDLGLVDLNGAIEVFENFPFANQLELLNNKEMTSCKPTIIFRSADKEILKIWMQNKLGHYLHYENPTKESDLFISYDFNFNPQGFIVEDVIEQFYNGTINQSLKLNYKINEKDEGIQKAKQNIDPIISYSFNNTRKLNFYAWTIPYLILAIILYKNDHDINFKLGWGFHLLFGIISWIPSTILHITYLFKSFGSIVVIDSKLKNVKIARNEEIIEFNRQEIVKSEVNESRSNMAPWFKYRYLLIVLKDHRCIIITNFITEPENIIDSLGLNFCNRKSVIPFLPIWK